MGSTWNEAAMEDFRSFEVSGAAHGVTEDLVLLSWLIVLLRTREDGQASFDWRYRSEQEGTQPRVILSEKVITAFNTTAEDVLQQLDERLLKTRPSLVQPL